jgi:hypothetical protein
MASYVPINLDECLATRVVGQRRTGKHKAFVFIDSYRTSDGKLIGGEYAIKGPFSLDRITVVEQRAKILEAWRLPFITKPLSRIEGQDLNGGIGGYYLVYPNLLKGEELVTTHYTESMVNYHGTSYSYHTLVRQGLVKLGDVILDIDWLNQLMVYEEEELPLAVWLMISMIGLFVLKVGDMHFANVLVNLQTHHIHIIDYDDNADNAASSEIFYFKMAPAKGKLSKWLGLVRPYYPRVVTFLGRFVGDPIYGDRFRDAIGCIIPIGIEEITKGMTQVTITSNPPRNPGGLMQYRGPFGGSITASGCPVDEVKSQLQKSIRRNEVGLALLSGFELYRFSEVPGAEGVVTNLYNRLAVIAAEDIGPANVGLVVEVLRLIGGDPRNKDPNVLGAIIQLLCLSSKTRIGSHLWYVYVNERGRGFAISKGLEVDDTITPEDQVAIDGTIVENGDPPDLVAMVVVFKRRLRSRMFEAMIWLAYFTKASEERKVAPRAIRPRRRQTDPNMMIWEALKELVVPQIWEVLVDTYLSASEKRPFLMMGVSSVLYGGEYQEFPVGPQAEEWKRTDAAVAYLNGTYHLVIQEEAIDKHTKRGRKEGKDRDTFVNDGAIVSPEDPRFVVPVFQEVYRM